MALADGSVGTVGDVIITRRNDRRLPITTTDFVKNGDRWTITAVGPDGSLAARHHTTRRRITLPAGYVSAHVTLGCATTVHTAQGITADTAHVVASGSETRQLLYVALTRGRSANHVYLTTAGDGDPHTLATCSKPSTPGKPGPTTRSPRRATESATQHHGQTRRPPNAGQPSAAASIPWLPLAAALDRAAASGYDVHAELPRLGAAAPLP